MKTVMENLVTLKCGRQTLLRPPISYIFPSEREPESTEFSTDFNLSTAHTSTEMVTVDDLNLLFRLKPWLLADMEALLEETFE